MDRLLPTVTLLLPLVPLLGAAATVLRPRRAAPLTIAAATLAALLAVGRAALIAAAPGRMAEGEGLTTAVATLVATLGWVIARYSRNALAGEPVEARFHRWLGLTLGFVLGLVSAADLLTFWLAWVGTSLGLHQLLTLYADRPRAVLCARQKFVVSRLGDVCLGAAVFLIGQRFGTWDFTGLITAVAAAPADQLQAPAVLVAVGALLKSAQVPFHSWLPDTLETPTPVSAFMHAGIINAGGFLVIRMSWLVDRSPAALTLLTLSGTVTAVYGAVVMLTQPTVKRSLAYSTIAQMGFMLLECGLGQFQLALVHLVAHSIYKAHAFLTSGSTVGSAPRAAVPLENRALLAAGVTAVIIIPATWYAVIGTATRDAILFVYLAVLAGTYGLARYWSVQRDARDSALGVIAITGFGFLYAGLHRLAPNASSTPLALPTSALVAVAMTALFALQVTLWRLHRTASGRRWYVHASHGFYLGTLANRTLHALWPVPSAR